ncbi:hypothetical protein DENSPDRAFT_886035 [Dentipellis sp. KUC8613]|nr:hypothetical protein DENSPDRAFT_886035 [Dentipellis sp. KUC8613]
MQPASHHSDHDGSLIPDVPQSQPAPSESLSDPHDPTSSQVTRLSADPLAFSRIGNGQQMKTDVCSSAPTNAYQQHLDQRTLFGVPGTYALPSQPQLMAAPPIRNDVPTSTRVPSNPSQPLALLPGSSYDPALNKVYLQFFGDEAELLGNSQDGVASRVLEGRPQEGPTQVTPSGASVASAPPSQAPSLRPLWHSSTSRPRTLSLTSSIIPPRLASKVGAAPSVTPPAHATPTFSLPTQKFVPASPISADGALCDPISVADAALSIPSDAAGLASLPSAPRPIPSAPHVERGTLAQSYAPPGHRSPLQSAGTPWQPYPPYWQLPPSAMGAFPGFRPAWVSPQAPAMPAPGYSGHPGYQTPSYLAGDKRSSLRQQNSHPSESPVFRFSVDNVSQPPPLTTQIDPPAQDAIPPGHDGQAEAIVNADLPYQGMPPPLPLVNAARLYPSFGPLPQTGSLTPSGSNDYTGSRVPQSDPQPAGLVSRPCSRASQSLQVVAAGPPQFSSSGAHTDVVPEPSTNQTPVPPQSEKRKASASPPHDATQVKPQTKRQVKRKKKGKGKATEPSAMPEDTVEDVPTLPGESQAAAHARRLRDARRARRFRELYAEIVTELSSPGVGRNPSDDDVLRLGVSILIAWLRWLVTHWRPFAARNVVQGLKVDIDRMKEEISERKRTEWENRFQLQEMAARLETSQQMHSETKRRDEEAECELEIAIQGTESGSSRMLKLQRLLAEKDKKMIQVEETLERTRTELKIQTEEAQRNADLVHSAAEKRQEQEHKLRFMQVELQWYQAYYQQQR